jgi:hypothetical protein
VRDSGDDHEPHVVVDRVHDPVVADADPEVVASGELDRASRPRLLGEAVDRGGYAITRWALEAPVSARRIAMEADLVRLRRLSGYARSSSQDTVSSRSSRARKAARLSSR